MWILIFGGTYCLHIEDTLVSNVGKNERVKSSTAEKVRKQNNNK